MRLDHHPKPDIDAAGLRIAVVTSRFNGTITNGLKDGALAFLDEAGCSEVLAVEAPGAFELPVLALHLARAGFDAVVCLGAVIKGDTDHYEHVAHRASEGLMRVQLDTGVPVAFGVLTVTDPEAAIMRSLPGEHNKGREAAAAAVETASTLRSLGDR